MSKIAQKWLKRLPLKLKDESFGAKKMSQKKIFRRKFHRIFQKKFDCCTILKTDLIVNQES